MAVTLPFDFIERNGNSTKITKEQDVDTWKNIEDSVNNLIDRCNGINGSTISYISLITQDSKGSPLSSSEYDSNITSIETSLNALIVNSEPQGSNPSNTVTLFKRGGQVPPLYIWQRDTNLRTIQTIMNSLNGMYIWAGV